MNTNAHSGNFPVMIINTVVELQISWCFEHCFEIISKEPYVVTPH